MISSAHSGLHPGGEQENGPRWQCGGTMCLPVLNHEALTFCPLSSAGASCEPPALFQFCYTHCLKIRLSLSERNAGMKLPLFSLPAHFNSRPLLRSACCSPSHTPTGAAPTHLLVAARACQWALCPSQGSGLQILV